MTTIPSHGVPSDQARNIDISHSETRMTFGTYSNRGQHASGSGTIVNNMIYQTASPLDVLEKHCSPTAAFDSVARFSSPRCAESTRLGIMQIIEDWITNDEDNTSSLFWLYGGPGVGKSAVAQSLSEDCQEKKELAASFFFVGSDATRNNPNHLIPTLVSHLVDSFEGIAQFVEDRICKNRNLFTKTYWIQIQELLIEPLLALKSTGTLVTHPRLIVIDGLDECQNSDIQCELLRVIARTLPRIPFRLRFLITSRPEAHITRVFNELQAIPIHQYNLGNDRDGSLEGKVNVHESGVYTTNKLQTMPSLRFPSFLKKRRRRLSWSSSATSTTTGVTSHAESLTFHSDSEIYDEVVPGRSKFKNGKDRPRDTMTGTEKSTAAVKWDSGGTGQKNISKGADTDEDASKMKLVPSHPNSKDDMGKLGRTNKMTETVELSALSKWRYGWGLSQKDNKRGDENVEGIKKSSSAQDNNLPLIQPVMMKDSTTGTKESNLAANWDRGVLGKKDQVKGKNLDEDEEFPHKDNLSLYQPVERRDSKSTQSFRRTNETMLMHDSRRTHTIQQTKSSQQSKETYWSGGSRSTAPKPRPPIFGSSESTLILGSAFERKISDQDSIPSKVDTTGKLDEMRRLMVKDNLDYYIVPTEDAYGSEYVASSDKRCEFISGFTGSAAQAIITRNSAFLFMDSSHWLQAEKETDDNWDLICTGGPNQPQDWIEWIVDQVKDSRIGIDPRMISHEKITILSPKIGNKGSKFIYSPQNLIDLIWTEKPTKSLEIIVMQRIEFTGMDAASKLVKLREWIKSQLPDTHPGKCTGPMDMSVGTLVTDLNCIAYILNLRGSDIPFSPLFHAYLFVGLYNAILFVEPRKLKLETVNYLSSIGVEQRNYVDVWQFLRRREWGDGRLLISPQTPYVISLMLTYVRYTIAPSYIEHMMTVKNETEVECLKKAYLRDGVSFVRFLAFLETKLEEGYDITEYEAASRLTAYRRSNKYFMGLAYKSNSASGPNAALPHYTPERSSAAMISRDLPYLIDSGAHYSDGSCVTARTMHFGQPTPEMCEAYTRVLQGHIAIDRAVFPKGISSRQLQVLSQKVLWEGLNYVQGADHVSGAFLAVHEDRHGLLSNTPLVPGQVIRNKPAFYVDGKWGMRIESTLVVKTRGTNNDFWLCCERLTCVPIQTRMVKESMLTREEKAWIKEHNQQCCDKITPFLKDDKRALRWLEREAKGGKPIIPPAALVIDWD